MRPPRFQYALQPVLLTRQWELDTLLRDLGQLNAEISAQRLQLRHTDTRRAQAGQEWLQLAGTPQAMPVERLSMLSRYMDSLARQAAATSNALSLLEEQQTVLADKVVVAQRSLEAVQDHRDEEQGKFLQKQSSSDFKSSDELWSMTLGRSDNHEH